MAKRKSEKSSPFKGVDTIEGIGFVVGAEAGNVINVGLTFKDADNKALAIRGNVYAYFSDDANGDSIIAVAPSGAVAIGVNGLLNVLEAKKQFRITSEANGLADINITEAGAKTMRLIVVLPDGALVASPAITFV